MDRLKITVGGKTYEIEVGDVTSSPASVRVDGTTYNVTWEREQAKVAVPTPAAAAPKKAAPTSVAEAPKAAAPAPKPASIAPSGGELVEISSPMPGKILQVNVSPGDAVAAQQQVCTLEAMKMESAIQSTAAGVIVSINVAPGDTVQHGDVLVVIEKRGE